MKRPQLIHFLSIITEEFINVKASINILCNSLDFYQKKRESFAPRFPIQAFRLLRMRDFNLKIVGLDDRHREVYTKVFESDSFGSFHLKIPLTDTTKKIQIIQVYELATYPGLELHIGTYLPIQIMPPKKIIICDFDKTLVETRWSSTRELYQSLVKPLNNFPTLVESVNILKKNIRDGFHPFIVSASPHFYEDAIRDWLYQAQIYTAGIFLKDYRKILSLFEMSLTFKDLKVQGLYKLNHLLDILLMTGIPDDLVLMGDNFESDPLIYLTLAMILEDDVGPWAIWNTLKEQKNFRLNKKQNSIFLNKIYQLSGLVKCHKNSKSRQTSLKIYIRKKSEDDQLNLPSSFEKKQDLIKCYAA